MPKKFTINSKSVQAKAKKNEKNKVENEMKQREIEDQLWKDDDKHTNNKLQRKVSEFDCKIYLSLIFINLSA